MTHREGPHGAGKRHRCQTIGAEQVRHPHAPAGVTGLARTTRSALGTRPRVIVQFRTPMSRRARLLGAEDTEARVPGMRRSRKRRSDFSTFAPEEQRLGSLRINLAGWPARSKSRKITLFRAD